MQAYGQDVKSAIAFYLKCKHAQDAKYFDKDSSDPKLKFYLECQKNNALAIPLFNKIANHRMLLRDIKLNSGTAKGFQGCMIMTKNLIDKLFLDNNCLDGNDLAHILNGLTYQQPFKTLIIAGKSNTFNEECAE